MILNDEDKDLLDNVYTKYRELFEKYQLLLKLAIDNKIDSIEYEKIEEDISILRDDIAFYDELLEVFIYEEDGRVVVDSAKTKAIIDYIEQKSRFGKEISSIPMDHLIGGDLAKIDEIAMVIRYQQFYRLGKIDDLSALDEILDNRDILINSINELLVIDPNDSSAKTMLEYINSASETHDSVSTSGLAYESVELFINALSHRFLWQLDKDNKTGKCSRESFLFGYYLSCFLDVGLEDDLLLERGANIGDSLDKFDIKHDSLTVINGIRSLALDRSIKMINLFMLSSDATSFDTNLQLTRAYMSSAISLLSEESKSELEEANFSFFENPQFNQVSNNFGYLARIGFNDADNIRKAFIIDPYLEGVKK